MADRVPSFFLLVPGPWKDAAQLIEGLGSQGIVAARRGRAPVAGGFGVDVVEDHDLARGFSWGRDGATPDELRAAVATCSRAALVEVGACLDTCAPQVAALGRALRALGGVAVRMEASGASSAWDPWLERLELGDPAELYRAGVIIVGDDESSFTCGMHQFDLPDAEIASTDARAATAWLDALCIFQLAEQPVLGTGHTFRPEEGAVRRVLERWPDTHHHPDDGRHNPFGLWRLLPEGEAGLQAQDPVLTIVPSLAAMLLAAENKKGKALTRAEVERLVNDAPAIAMAPRDSVALERSRGYADLEPRLAWAQWQAFKSARA